MKTLVAFFLVLLAVSCIFAQSSNLPAAPQPKAASGASAGPGKDEVEVALKRTLGYDPSVTWTVYDVRPSGIPGVSEILISLNKQDPIHIYWDANTQTAVVGQIMPFGANPYVSVRARLEAADGPAIAHQTPVISMIEFSDLECPHCKAAQPIMEKLAGDFPQVRYVFQQFPLPASMHPWALKAAEYSDCAGRLNAAAFWKYTDSIFENQPNIALATADDKLKELATAAGLDPQKLATCAALPQTEARVKKSVELGQSLDVTQTPTLFINGRRVLGIADIPYDQLKSLVQFEIDHAGK